MGTEVIQRPDPRQFNSRQEVMGYALSLASEHKRVNIPGFIDEQEATKLVKSTRRTARRLSSLFGSKFTSLTSQQQTEAAIMYKVFSGDRNREQRREASQIGSTVSLLRRKGLLTADLVDTQTGKINIAALRSKEGTQEYIDKIALLEGHSLSTKSKLRQEAQNLASSQPVEPDAADTHTTPRRSRVKITIDPRLTGEADDEQTTNGKGRAVRIALAAGGVAAIVAACGGLSGVFSGGNPDNHRQSAASSARVNAPYILPSESPSAPACIVFDNGGQTRTETSDPNCGINLSKQEEGQPGDGKGKGAEKQVPEQRKGIAAKVKSIVRRITPTPSVPTAEIKPTPTPTNSEKPTPTPSSTPKPSPSSTPHPTPTPSPTPSCTPTPYPPSPSPYA